MILPDQRYISAIPVLFTIRKSNLSLVSKYIRIHQFITKNSVPAVIRFVRRKQLIDKNTVSPSVEYLKSHDLLHLFIGVDGKLIICVSPWLEHIGDKHMVFLLDIEHQECLSNTTISISNHDRNFCLLKKCKIL